MAAALSLALAALLVLQAPPPDPAGDAPPPLDAPAPDEPPPAADPIAPLPDAGEAAQPRTDTRPGRTGDEDDGDEDDSGVPEPDARTEPLASGAGIGVGTAVGGILLGALPAAACGWVPFLGIPIACFGAAVGAGAGGVIATVLTGGDLDGNVLLLGGAAGIAGAVAFLGAAAGTVAVLSLTQGSGNAVLLGVALASGASFLGATVGSIGAGVLTATFPPPLRAPPPPKKKPGKRRAPDGDGAGDALDALHHPPIRY